MAITRPVIITAACTLSVNSRMGMYTENITSINTPDSTFFQVLPPLSAAERSTLLHSFLPKGSRIRKPLSIPTLIRIITTPNCRPVALSSISAEDA